MDVTQKSFADGMNLVLPDTQISENGYRWLVNGRNRLGYIEPTFSNKQINNAPPGIKQGIIAVGDVLLLFVAGKAYFQIDGTDTWQQIGAFTMSATATRYYTIAVPANTFNQVRKLNTEGSSAPILTSQDFNIAGNPAGVLVQDGTNQPWIIFYYKTTNSFTARETKKYADWSNISTTVNTREYVPIGLQMFVLNEKLFILSRDRKKIYHSITGRPLDFMVNIDVNGNKLATEAAGGADSVSFAFDNDEITCLAKCSITDSFIYGTARNVRIITADYTRTLFGEPRFSEATIIEAGIVQQDCILETLGDYVFIDFENVKSFNAVQQLNTEGNNSFFSLQLQGILEGVKQTDPRCVSFNNYGLFYLKTTWGNAILVYDMLRENWCSVDMTVADQIKEFAIVETTTTQKLYAITHQDELFHMYGDDTREFAMLYTRALMPDDSNVSHKGAFFRPVMRGGKESGKLYVTEYVDEYASNTVLSVDLESVSSGVDYPVRPPVMPHTKMVMHNDGFVFKDGRTGKKIAYLLQWGIDAKLQEFQIITSEIKSNTSQRQITKTLV